MMTRARGVLLAVIAAGTAAAGTIRLGGNIEATAVATGTAPDSREKRAAAEVVDYLARITGKRLPQIEIAGSKVAAGTIVVGRLSQTAGLISARELEGLGPDGYVLKVSRGRVAACGVRSLGTTYAAYALLRMAGVKFYAQDCEIVRPSAIVVFPQTTARVSPRFEGRGILALERYCGIKPSLRLGFGPRDDEGDPAEFGEPTIEGHSSDFLVPFRLYGDTHPEYFALDAEGRRLRRIPGERFDVHLCMSNPEVRRIARERTLALIEKQKDRRQFVVTQGDGYGWCQCERCKALDTVPGTVMTDRLLDFVNDIARAVGKRYPDKVLLTAAYTDATAPPPARVSPEPNVRIAYCPYPKRAGCQSHDLSCPLNRQASEDVRGWLAKSPRQMYVFDYPRGYANWYEPFGSFYAMVRKVKSYADSGIRGMYYCVVPENFRDLFMFVQGRLLWERDADVEALVDEFLPAYYGKAAPAVREYFDFMHRQIAGDAAHQNCERSNPQLVTAAYADRALEIFARAQQAVAADPVALARVEREKFCVLWADLLQRNLSTKRVSVSREEFARRVAEAARIARAMKLEVAARGKPGPMSDWLNYVAKTNIAATPWYADPAAERLVSDPAGALAASW